MPNSLHSGDSSQWIPQPLFVPRGANDGIDARAVACPLSDGGGATRLAVMSGVQILDSMGGNPQEKTLAVGLQSNNRLVVVDESDPTHPQEIGSWTAPGGSPCYRMPVLDDGSATVAFPVSESSGTVWHILSLVMAGQPREIATIKGMGTYGAMSGGMLYSASNNSLWAVDMNKQVQIIAHQAATAASLNAIMNPMLGSVQKMAAMVKAVVGAGSLVAEGAKPVCNISSSEFSVLSVYPDRPAITKNKKYNGKDKDIYNDDEGTEFAISKEGFPSLGVISLPPAGSTNSCKRFLFVEAIIPNNVTVTSVDVELNINGTVFYIS